MVINEIKSYIEAIQGHHNKTIQAAYNKCKKLLISISKNSEKIKDGSKKLIEETDPQLTEEGVQKITKKGKIYFRSLKAFNALLHYIDNDFSNFSVPNTSDQLTYDELNQFVRALSRLMNDTNAEKAKSDKIMGLDFMLKKRSIYGPLTKMMSDLSDLRTLQKEEYRVIKTLEDLESLKSDVKGIQQQISRTEEEIIRLQNEVTSIKQNKEEAEQELTLLLENSMIKNSRERGIRMTELEIKMGRHLNSFTKIFKKYAREIQRGTISGEFGLVGTALGYEKDPVKRFLNEEEGNPEVIALLEELIKVGKSDLRLKQKNISNLQQELRLIQNGILDPDKKEWHDLLNAKEKEITLPEFKTVNNKLAECEKKLERLKGDLSMKEEYISLKTRELNQFSDSLSERSARASDLKNDILEP
jgi:archaellum component FlaC